VVRRHVGVPGLASPLTPLNRSASFNHNHLDAGAHVRVLVIGGTGFNGRRIVARLLEHGHRVSVISRGDLPSAWRERVAHIRVDRKDTAAFASACAGLEFDAVIDNVAYTPADAGSALEAFGTRIGQYLFTSTMAVYHDLLQRTSPIHEDEVDLDYRPAPDEGLQTALHPTRGHAYAIEKREVEQVVRRASVPWTALRASMIVGPDDWVGVVWWWVQRILDGGPILVPDTGHGHFFQVTYVEDLADAFVAALGNPLVHRRAYNVAGADLLTAESLADALATPLGQTATCVRVPPTLIAAAGLSEYRVPLAGLPFGHVLLDTCRAQHELSFAGTPLDAWARVTSVGCAESPPEAASRHYELRAREIVLAREYADLRAEADAAFLERLHP
jgi:nucleoside-diphosphate-sugar epimerase